MANAKIHLRKHTAKASEIDVAKYYALFPVLLPASALLLIRQDTASYSDPCSMQTACFLSARRNSRYLSTLLKREFRALYEKGAGI